MAWTDHKWAFILLILLASMCLTEKPREMYENATASANRRRKLEDSREFSNRVKSVLHDMGEGQ